MYLGRLAQPANGVVSEIEQQAYQAKYEAWLASLTTPIVQTPYIRDDMPFNAAGQVIGWLVRIPANWVPWEAEARGLTAYINRSGQETFYFSDTLSLGRNHPDVIAWLAQFPTAIYVPPGLLGELMYYPGEGGGFFGSVLDVAKDVVSSPLGVIVAMPFVVPMAASALGWSTTAAGGTTVGAASGAELAALIESGTVGVEGAFLEATALSGGTVAYSTATGELIGATLPSGATIAYDAAVDPFAQFGLADAAPSVSDFSMPSLSDASSAISTVQKGAGLWSMLTAADQQAKTAYTAARPVGAGVAPDEMNWWMLAGIGAAVIGLIALARGRN
jgi:hypothetical protein